MNTSTSKILMSASLRRLNNPRLRCMPDQITGKKYALCLMETDNPNELRVASILSPFYSPKELTAFMNGYFQATVNNLSK